MSVEVPPAGGLQAIYLQHRGALIRFLRARGAGDRAEDLVQELWLRIAGAPTGPLTNPVGYLYQAANNLMINAHREQQRAAVRDERWGDAQGGDAHPSSHERLAAQQEVARVRERLAGAGERVLASYFLFRVEGMKQRDIAFRLGVSVSTVEKDIQRAYRELAALRDEQHD